MCVCVVDIRMMLLRCRLLLCGTYRRQWAGWASLWYSALQPLPSWLPSISPRNSTALIYLGDSCVNVLTCKAHYEFDSSYLVPSLQADVIWRLCNCVIYVEMAGNNCIFLLIIFNTAADFYSVFQHFGIKPNTHFEYHFNICHFPHFNMDQDFSACCWIW